MANADTTLSTGRCPIFISCKIALIALAFLMVPLFIATPPAVAEPAAAFYVSPNGSGNQCTPGNRCAIATALNSCYATTVVSCWIDLADGVYPDPNVNIYYYRRVGLTGNCNAPQNVIFRAMTPGATLVWIQDHAIGLVRCLTLDAYVGGVIGLAARQHAIADWDTIMFGNMPGGQHVFMNEYSIASCLGQNWIMGGAVAHASAVNSSKINLGCKMYVGPSVAFTQFASATYFSIIDAAQSSFSGFPVGGVGCNSGLYGIATPPAQGFPGSRGNC